MKQNKSLRRTRHNIYIHIQGKQHLIFWDQVLFKINSYVQYLQCEYIKHIQNIED
jgi:hypothetical protein